MEEKYLPIGTVCTIKNNNKKVMIISYFSMEYNNNVTLYDYKGCVYPEGLLLPSQEISFNHSDIVSVDFLGYKNEQFEVLNNNLNRGPVEGTEYEEKEVLSNFKFDENGVVIFDPTAKVETTVAAEEEKVNNPFAVENRNVEAKKDDKDIFSNFKFDENGVVIADESSKNNNPVSDSIYEFDENGFVISDKSSKNVEASNNGAFQFDENGVVIADGTVPKNKPSTGGYQFDENGVVISEG